MICFLWFMMSGRMIVFFEIVVLKFFFVMVLIRLFGISRVVFFLRMFMMNNRILFMLFLDLMVV